MRASFRFKKRGTIFSGVNKLHEVMSWEELGQWCWVQMLCLKRAWQTAPSFCGELPSAESEESIDSHVRSMLRSPEGLLVTPEENKPWILARLLFGSGLLQPRNVSLLGIPELSDPGAALAVSVARRVVRRAAGSLGPSFAARWPSLTIKL